MNILIAHLENLAGQSGGLERVVCNFANEFMKRGHRVSIVKYESNDGRPFYPLDERVPLYNLWRPEDEPRSILRKCVRETYRLCGKKAMKIWESDYRRKAARQRLVTLVGGAA